MISFIQIPTGDVAKQLCHRSTHIVEMWNVALQLRTEEEHSDFTVVTAIYESLCC